MGADEPKTIAEQLDAAESGEEFGQVLMSLFATIPCGAYYPKWGRHCDQPAGHDGRHTNACVSWTDEMAEETP